ncbi:MAG TPA: hypothetical protein DCR17_09650 [Verrucomicrobiales bacterium]|nr:hypothetical protein [Pedosphaera sp.]HAO66935.1 hypothetical protein [Verrucomicrobiales bacterium]HAQ98009.1 hypothetical protein [Verrucomicrobiales bacterium]HAW02113.1 hypothetical protein [Verrucomicrobiales bacterium]HBP54856.1 hypothetical protein [Verrucomicrobiales bacterium]|tara:strand:+ start:479 stop:676 length:198 start_codon:yes stop_codon:yes gene_type:complete
MVVHPCIWLNAGWVPSVWLFEGQAGQAFLQAEFGASYQSIEEAGFWFITFNKRRPLDWTHAFGAG